MPAVEKMRATLNPYPILYVRYRGIAEYDQFVAVFDVPAGRACAGVSHQTADEGPGGQPVGQILLVRARVLRSLLKILKIF